MENDWDLFIRKFETLSKIDLKSYKRPQMERRINSFMRTVNAGDYKSFIDLLGSNREVYRKFLDHITINVSEFFRNTNHWEIMEKQITPVLLKDNKKLRIWSAGCSTGEEAYSLAMMCSESHIDLSDPILATDIDNEVLEKAALGIYSGKAVQSLPSSYLEKYFVPEGSFYRIKDNLKKMVRFQQQDLLKDSFGRAFDLILCRNVVIYFTEESKQRLYRKFCDALRPGGVLFIGSTEQIFQARELGLQSIATFFYQKI
ncbi:CheR family methyltransferase [Syntrophomonas curvata]